MAPPHKKRRVRPVVPGQPAQQDPQDLDAPPETPPPQAERPVAGPEEDAGVPQVLGPADGPPPESTNRQSWTMEAAGKDAGVVLGQLKDDVGYWVQKGRYNKVRLSREGKQLLPDIPVAALMAVEVAGFAWAGLLRTALVNVAGRLLFKVELINDAAEHLEAARGHYAKGDLDEAEAETVRALKVDARMPEGFLMLGTLAKVRGKTEEALRHFQKARDLDPHGETGRRAEEQGRRLDPSFGPPKT